MGSRIHVHSNLLAARPGAPVTQRGVVTMQPRHRPARAATVPPMEERDALGHLFRSEAPHLRRYFRRKTGDAEAAADLVQDTFLKMATAPKNGIVNPAAYLQRIARNLLVDRFRERRYLGQANTIPLDECDLVVPPIQEEISRYEQAIRGLSDKTRKVFLLQRVEGLTYERISIELGISVSTVEYHMMRALVHLDRVLEEL